MRRHPRHFLVPLLLFLLVMVCQTTLAKDEVVKVGKKEWATFSGRASFKEKKSFPSRGYVKKMNGRNLTASKRSKRMDCIIEECKLHPGNHSLTVIYFWSPTHTNAERTAENVRLFLGILVGVVVGAAPPLDQLSWKIQFV